MVPHGIAWTFLAGFFGSAAVELVTMDELFRRSARLPARYRKWSFWLVRLFLAFAGGALAVGYNIQNLVAAAQMGASPPTMIKSLAKFQRR